MAAVPQRVNAAPVMDIPGPTKLQFLNFKVPEEYGFAGCRAPDADPDCLGISLFPLESSHKVRIGARDGITQEQVNYHNLFTQLCGMIAPPAPGSIEPTNNSAAATGENFQKMPGIIYCASLSAPHLNLPGRAPFPFEANNAYIDHTTPEIMAWPVGARGQSIDGWLDEYAFLIMNNMIPHYVFNLPHSPGQIRYMWNQPPTEASIAAWRSWAGFNFFVDVTSSTILSYQFDVAYLLEKWQRSEILIRLGEETEMDWLRHLRLILISLLRSRLAFYNIRRLSLFEFITISCYNIAAYVKGEYTTADFVVVANHEARAVKFLNKEARAQDHNIRMYFYHRAARLLRESDLQQHGIARTNAWLGVGQYIRYLIWAQNKFELYDIPCNPCEKMIHRDAHACTTTLFSATIDQWFFNNCPAERTIMAGNSQQYHRDQHVTLDPTGGRRQAALSGHSRNGDRLGVLAGVMWSKNPDPENRFLGYDFIRAPFLDTINANGSLAGTIGNVAYNNPWDYGLDEYILSMLFRFRANNRDAVDEVRILSYYLSWMYHYFGYPREDADRVHDSEELWAPIQGLYNMAYTYYTTPGANNIAGTPDFYNQLFNRCSGNAVTYNLGGPQICFNTLFGNAGNKALRVPANQRNNTGTPADFAGNKKRNACNLQNYFRYDRFDYFNNPAVRMVDGQPVILTNLNDSFLENMALALNLAPMSIEARQGVPGSAIPEDQAPGAILCAAIPLGMQGGKRRKTQKNRK